MEEDVRIYEAFISMAKCFNSLYYINLEARIQAEGMKEYRWFKVRSKGVFKGETLRQVILVMSDIHNLKMNQEYAKTYEELCNFAVQNHYELLSLINDVLDMSRIKSGNTYDAVFMDIQMPVMDGYEAARAIRALKKHSDARTMPIIAMTANAFADDIEKALAAGINTHVCKPVDMLLLGVALSRLLKE